MGLEDGKFEKHLAHGLIASTFPIISSYCYFYCCCSIFEGHFPSRSFSVLSTLLLEEPEGRDKRERELRASQPCINPGGQ